MSEAQQPLFDGPIPGMAMTAELGARPWQSPSQYVTVDDAVEYYLSRMSSEEFTEQLIDVMEMGVPLTTIANTIQMASVMEGKHTVDVGMLVIPLLIEMMMLIGDTADVKYDDGLTEVKEDKTSEAVLDNVRRKLKKQLSKSKEKVINNKEEEEESIEKPSGLMTRRM